ncbi:MAG: NAD(P)(+) transhydrogenase (Re/Si-specific) subunit alpha, partial [Ignavibacteriaceae bacterium]|nr:NAD(P)(+) transhydrogenase (Re/Si-specific) subunit alpha [Ignavibacteriaceae bacterium]
MVIGVPKEIIDGEKRVALTPDTAAKLIKAGFTVQVESGAGTEANYTDEMYGHAGVKISGSLKELYSGSDIILKVQRPAFNDKAGMN